MLTPRGRGAVAVIEVRGPHRVQCVDEHFAAANTRSLAEQPIRGIRFGNWRATGEEVVVVPRDTTIEVHCHGGIAAAEAIVASLTSDRCSLEQSPPSGESIEEQALLLLARATTESVAAMLLDQYHGALRCELSTVCAEIAAGKQDRAKRLLTKLQSRCRLGLHLAEPWRVVLAGEANVGKSSLLNDLLGYDRAIVFDEPGTTRDVVSASTAIDGLPVLLSDTAGLRAPSDDIEAAGIALTNQLMAQADVVLLVVEGEQLLRDTKLTLNKLREWQHYHVASGATIVVISKCDVLTDEAINRAMYHVEQSTPWPVVPISVLEDWGTDELLACMASELVPALPPAESGIPFTPLQCETINAALECLTRSANGEATSVLQQLLSLGTRDSSPPADSADCTNSSD